MLVFPNVWRTTPGAPSISLPKQVPSSHLVPAVLCNHCCLIQNPHQNKNLPHISRHIPRPAIIRKPSSLHLPDFLLHSPFILDGPSHPKDRILFRYLPLGPVASNSSSCCSFRASCSACSSSSSHALLLSLHAMGCPLVAYILSFSFVAQIPASAISSIFLNDAGQLFAPLILLSQRAPQTVTMTLTHSQKVNPH